LESQCAVSTPQPKASEERTTEVINFMEYTISPISNEDLESIIDIFNYYIENSFAAYPENKFPYQTFDMLLQMSNGFPTGSIRDQNGKIAGFGMLRAHNPMPTFSQTAEVTYFIHPDPLLSHSF